MRAADVTRVTDYQLFDVVTMDLPNKRGYRSTYQVSGGLVVGISDSRLRVAYLSGDRSEVSVVDPECIKVVRTARYDAATRAD